MEEIIKGARGQAARVQIQNEATIKQLMLVQEKQAQAGTMAFCRLMVEYNDL